MRYALDFLNEEDKVWMLGRTAGTVLNWPRPKTGWEWDRTTKTAR